MNSVPARNKNFKIFLNWKKNFVAFKPGTNPPPPPPQKKTIHSPADNLHNTLHWILLFLYFMLISILKCKIFPFVKQRKVYYRNNLVSCLFATGNTVMLRQYRYTEAIPLCIGDIVMLRQYRYAEAIPLCIGDIVMPRYCR